MAVINTKKESVPLKAYLRADSYSQHFEYYDDSGEKIELVTDEMFWGKNSNDGIYVDYSLMKDRKIRVSEGISFKNGTQTLRGNKCDIWLENNIINLNWSRLVVFQGYAGCGKSTFMNNLIRKKNEHATFCYIDIGQDWTYPQEPHMFFNEVLYAFDKYLDDIIKANKIRTNIWNYFINIGKDINIKELDLEIPNVISDLIKIKENSQWKSLRVNIHNYLYNKYSDVSANNTYSKNKENNLIWNNCGQTQTIVSLLILMICATSCYGHGVSAKEKTYTLIFDNLDVITNPTIPAENVILLWGVIDRFIKFKKLYKKKVNKDLPNIGLFITVRKVLYSHITSHLPDLEMSTNLDSSVVNVCDISDLYISQDILNHRISYWKKMLNNEVVVNKLTKLGEMASIHVNNDLIDYEVNENYNNEFELQKTLNLDALFNHNYRAFSNVLSVMFDDERYIENFLKDFSVNSCTADWQKVATLIFYISLLYKGEEVWNKMGFGCGDFQSIDYPTTLNRLILNYLYIAKCGQALQRYVQGKTDMPSEDYVTLKQLVDVFKEVKFLVVDVNLNDNQIRERYNRENDNITKDLILERLAEMCARNPKVFHLQAYGYDPDDDELWRRPLYFVDGVKLNHTATSCKALKMYFEDCLANDKADQIKFSITDEGFILIRDLVASFEFYSARYCKDKLERPLHQAKSLSELKELITPVYNAINLCCERHKFFMNEYMKKYNINLNSYLIRHFHPRTKPRFDSQNVVAKKLVKSSFRPQLHIVRVIYAHIAYFNEVKKMIYESCLSQKSEMCQYLTEIIGEYLNLYKKNFFESLQDTICKPDNKVYSDLIKLYEEQMKHYRIDGDQKNIYIGNIRPSLQ